MIIYDFSGKDMYYKHIVQPLIKSIDVFLFVYDCSEKKSFEKLKEKIDLIKRERGKIKAAIISNKNDYHNKQVQSSEGKSLANENNFEFFECFVENTGSIKEVF